MRKFLAVILAVLTLVSIVLPVFAAEETGPADMTTADDAKNLGLIVTEYISDSKSPDVGPIVTNAEKGTTVASTTYNAFQYIEIYNSGDVPVDLYKVAIGAASDKAADSNGNKYWADLHLFQKKMTLRAGSIYTGVSFAENQASYSSNKAENPNSGVLEPGKTAIIWFWNDDTHTIASKMTTSPGAAVDGVYHKGFRDFYNVPADTLVLAVYAGSDESRIADENNGDPNSACGRFHLNIDGGWCRYGLIDESGLGVNGWSVSNPIWDKENGYNERILCLFGWGTSTHHSVQPAEGKATVYVPANTDPKLYNENIKASLETEEELAAYVPAADYVANEYVDGYMELAVLDFEQVPTPGVIPAWQAAYIKASKGTTLDTTEQATIDAFVSATKKVPEIVEGEREEEIEVIFKDRSELGNKKQNEKNDGGEGKGLPVWALILIIVGGVLVLGGVAAVIVFVVILPANKKKKAALAAAAESEAAEAAPAEEAAPEKENTEE